MKKVLLFVAAMFCSLMVNSAVLEVADGNGLSWQVAQLQAGDTLLITSDTVSWAYDLTVTQPFVMLAKEGVKAVINMPAKFNVSNGVIVKGVTFIGNGTNEVFRFKTGAGYSAIFDGCTFRNFHYAIRIYGPIVQLEKLTINNCIFDTYDSYVVYTQAGVMAPGEIKEFVMTNSTVMNGGSNPAVYICDDDGSASTAGPKVTIDHCTFYKNAKSNYTLYLYKIGADAKISNCIVSNPDDAQATAAYYGYDGNFVDNCIWYNCSNGARSGSVSTNLTNADPMFVSPATGDLMLKIGSPAIGAGTDKTNLGDPRWGVQGNEFAFNMSAPASDVNATDSYTITWTAVDPNGNAKVKLEYSADKTSWTEIASNLDPTAGSYAWNIRAFSAATYFIRGTLADAENTKTDVAAGRLTIVPDTEAPRAIDAFKGEVSGNTLALTWVNPTVDVPFEEPFDISKATSHTSGAATATLAVDAGVVTATYSSPAWERAGIALACNLNNMTGTISFDIKGSTGHQVLVMAEENNYDWWYKSISLNYTDYTTIEVNATSMKNLDWHNHNPAATFDGNNVTALYIIVNDGAELATGEFSVKNVKWTGAVPASADYNKTIIRVLETEFPTSISDGVAVYEGTDTTCDYTIDPAKSYFFSAFALDDLGNVSTAANYQQSASVVVPTADRRIFAYDLRMTEAEGVCTFAFKTNIAPTEANIVLYRGGEIIDRKVVEVSEALTYSVPVNKADIAGNAGEKMAWGVEVKAGKVKAIAEIFNEGVSVRQRMFLNMDLSTESPYFGRIYSNNRKAAGDVSGAVYGQDYSVINAAAVSLGNAARPGVDAEGTVYWSDYGDGTAGIRVMNPETFESAQLFQGTKASSGLFTSTSGAPMCGSTMCAEISGVGADTKLWVCNEDAATGLQAQGLAMFQLGQEDGSIAHTWDAAPTWAPALSHNAGSCFAMSKTKRGLWWAQNRGKGQNLNANRSLMFINNNGTIKWVSDDQVLINGSNGGGMSVNADESKVYLVNGDGDILVFDVTWNEADTVPTLTRVDSIVTPYSHICSIVFDPAGNMVTAAGAYGTKMSLVVYSMPTDNNEVIIPAAKSQAIEFAAATLEEVVAGKTIRRAVASNDAVYVLAIDAQKAPTLVKADFEGNVVTTYATDFCTVSTAAASEAGCMILSDIALTADGVLVGINAEHAHTTKVEGTQPIVYKWAADGTGAIWINTDNLVGGNENFAAGNFGNATVDMIAYSGTLADGEIVMRAMTQGSGNRSRFGIMKIVEGAFSKATRNQDLNAFTATADITLIAAPTKGNYIWGGAGIAPIEWTPAYTETALANGATPTLVATMATDYTDIKDFSVAKKADKDLMIIPAAGGAKVLDVTAGLDKATITKELSTETATPTFMYAALVADGAKVMLMRDANIVLLDFQDGPATSLFDMETAPKAIKVIRDGQIYIIRDNVMYNLQGAIVK